MTQHPQTQPVESPENPGLLRRSFEAVRGMPWAMGAEMTAHSAAEKLPLPTRNEALAIGAAVVVASGAGASVASAKSESQKLSVVQSASESNWEPTPAERAQFCKDTTLGVPTVTFRYVWKKNKNGKRVPSRTMRLSIVDHNPNPGIISQNCNDFEAKPREFEIMPQIIATPKARKGEKGKKRKPKNNAPKATLVRVADGQKIGNSAFYDKRTIQVNKLHVSGKTKSQIKVKETYFPVDGPPVSKVSYHKNIRYQKTPGTYEPI